MSDSRKRVCSVSRSVCCFLIPGGDPQLVLPTSFWLAGVCDCCILDFRLWVDVLSLGTDGVESSASLSNEKRKKGDVMCKGKAVR